MNLTRSIFGSSRRESGEFPLRLRADAARTSFYISSYINVYSTMQFYTESSG